ncbi:MAG TPA: hypothetical protein VL727_18485 [Puia sp.]|jgi:hypothetical protein|nr:hypothetical protein [Puia sp.]
MTGRMMIFLFDDDEDEALFLESALGALEAAFFYGASALSSRPALPIRTLFLPQR